MNWAPARTARRLAQSFASTSGSKSAAGAVGRKPRGACKGASRGDSGLPQHRSEGGFGGGCLLLASPLLFTEFDNTSAPKSELIFTAGNALRHCTERFFENEYGQSIFTCALGLVYLALLGHEGKIHGAVWRMKHLFATDFRLVGHPRYAYALPKNPLLAAPAKAPQPPTKP